MVVWFCCVLVLPNKDGVELVCCVDVPLKDVISSSFVECQLVHTIAMASPVADHRKVLLRVLLQLAVVSVYWLPMRLQRDRRSRAAKIVQSKSQTGLRSQAQLSQACSCCRTDLQMQAETLQVVLILRKALLTGLVVLV